MKRTKQFRRAQVARKKNKFRRIARGLNFGSPPITKKELDKWVGLISTTPTPNNCQCCCSPRFSSWYNLEEKLTMQERKSNRDFQNQLKELYDEKF